MQSQLIPVLPESLVTVNSSDDMASYLRQQHAEIKALFENTLTAVGVERAALFLSLRLLIATHEATEEELVHPAAQRALGAKGRSIVLSRLEEERGAATTITTIERLSTDTPQFELELRKLFADVVEHATHEENEELPALSGVTFDRLDRVRDVARDLYSNAESIIEGRPRTRDIGPFVALLNHARDLLAGNRSREGNVTFTHAAR